MEYYHTNYKGDKLTLVEISEKGLKELSDEIKDSGLKAVIAVGETATQLKDMAAFMRAYHASGADKSLPADVRAKLYELYGTEKEKS